MINKEYISSWNEIECDLYEENGHIFGIELDLFNNHEYFYHKTIRENGLGSYLYFEGCDIYEAIGQFNELLEGD